MNVSEQIKAMRAETGLSQGKFAALFNIPVRTLQDWEQGRYKTTPHVISMMKRIMDLEGRLSVRFRDDQHKADYLRLLGQMKSADCYHQAVAYLLALDEVVVNHVDDVFDFAGDMIKFETALDHGWHTGTSYKTTRLIMNLWNGWNREFDAEGEAFPSVRFAVDNIFSCSYAPYYWEAIKLRFPEYCNQ